jgi:hypothetical protein
MPPPKSGVEIINSQGVYSRKYGVSILELFSIQGENKTGNFVEI